MKTLRSVATKHFVWFALATTLVWFVLSLVFMGVASGALRRPYSDPVSRTLGWLAVTACLVLLLWRVGWLETVGIARVGTCGVWLLALVGTLAFGGASVYAFYRKADLDVTRGMAARGAATTTLTQLAVAMSEEILFRGLVLYTLVRAWGASARGRIKSVSLTTTAFAVLHLTNVVTYGVSLPAASLLTLETLVIATWCGALVLTDGSIWPAVVRHTVGNGIVAVQELALPPIEPEVLAYSRVLLFSLPLGALGLGLLWRAARPLALSKSTSR